MTTEHALETLSTELNAHLLCGEFETCADPRNFIRTSNRLLDACIACGMAYEHDDHVGWAAERVAAWLCSAECVA